MKIKNLKVGDKVFIREGLVPDEHYGAALYKSTMVQGWCKVREILNKSGTFSVKTDNGNRWEFLYHYTPEMVDWEKTKKLQKNNYCDFEKITQYGECRNEITKGVTYGGKEIVAKNNREKNDPEKAVMLLMLKARGVTYSDIKEEAKKVEYKWKPLKDDRYYYIRDIGDISSCFWRELSWDYYRLDANNCFKTRKDAEEKLEKIKEVLRGE